MKKRAALWIAIWLLMQSVLGVAAAYHPCCLGDCDGIAAHCQQADCRSCAVPAAMVAPEQPAWVTLNDSPTPMPAQLLRPRVDHAIWRPPCSALIA